MTKSAAGVPPTYSQFPFSLSGLSKIGHLSREKWSSEDRIDDFLGKCDHFLPSPVKFCHRIRLFAVQPGFMQSARDRSISLSGSISPAQTTLRCLIFWIGQSGNVPMTEMREVNQILSRYLLIIRLKIIFGHHLSVNSFRQPSGEFRSRILTVHLQHMIHGNHF